MMSLKEACQVLGVPYHSVLYHYHEGRIPVTHTSGRYLVEPDTLRRTLAELGYRKKGQRRPHPIAA